MLPVTARSYINHAIKTVPYINLLKSFGWLLWIKYLCREKGLRNTFPVMLLLIISELVCCFYILIFTCFSVNIVFIQFCSFSVIAETTLQETYKIK